MHALVTGGAGFIGSHLADKLLFEGHSVTVWDNLFTGKRENVSSGCNFEERDLRKNIETDDKFDIIYHLGALARIQPSFENPNLTHDVNVTGTIKVLELARRLNIPLIYAGSSSVYHDVHANPYSFTKWLGEQYCELYSKVYGLNVGIARFFNVYGPRHLEEGPYATVIAIFERQKKEGKPLTVTGTGEKRRDFTHVYDIINGLYLMGKQGSELKGEIFNFGTGTNYSINEVAAMFNPVEIEYIPNRPGEAETTLADISFSKERLNWEPSWKLENYVKEVLGESKSPGILFYRNY